MDEQTIINEQHEFEHLKAVLESAKHNQQVVFDQVRSLEGLPEIEKHLVEAIRLIHEELEKLG